MSSHAPSNTSSNVSLLDHEPKANAWRHGNRVYPHDDWHPRDTYPFYDAGYPFISNYYPYGSGYPYPTGKFPPAAQPYGQHYIQNNNTTHPTHPYPYPYTPGYHPSYPDLRYPHGYPHGYPSYHHDPYHHDPYHPPYQGYGQHYNGTVPNTTDASIVPPSAVGPNGLRPPDMALHGNCPFCRVGVMEPHYGIFAILCAIVFFPCGIIGCLLMKERQCSNCRAVFR